MLRIMFYEYWIVCFQIEQLVNKIVINNLWSVIELKRIEDSNHGNETYFKIRKCINIITIIIEHVQNNKFKKNHYIYKFIKINKYFIKYLKFWKHYKFVFQLLWKDIICIPNLWSIMVRFRNFLFNHQINQRIKT
jgi:hypothetical protein